MNEPTGYFLGVDGGQSATIAVIGDAQGRIVGQAKSGPCNHVAASEARAKFVRVLRECIGQACETAGIAPEFEAACLGMSGGPDDKAELLGEVFRARHVEVTHDARIALAGATEGKPGIVAIAGTGSIAYGENALGETARAGGWGHIFGDEGGAFDIARKALGAALREFEGWGPGTALTPALLEFAGARNANEVLHSFYAPEWPRHRVAEFAATVDQIATAGDPIAASILRSAGQDLAVLVSAVRARLASAVPLQVSWIGGAFRSAILLERFTTLVALDPGLSPCAPRRSPAAGALILAYRAAGLATLPELRAIEK